MSQYSQFNDHSAVISVRMSKDQAKQLKATAKRLNTNRNNLINQAIKHYLEMVAKFTPEYNR